MQKYCTTNITKVWCCLFAIGILLLMAACGSSPATANNSTPTVAPTTVPTTAPTIAPTVAPTIAPTTAPTTAPSGGNSVTIASFAFSPDSLTVKVGTKVTWTNNDSVGHTATADQGAFNSPTISSSGGTYSFTFTHPGTFTYHCAIHPSMTATIIVQ